MREKKSFFTENNQLNKGYKSEKTSATKAAIKADLPDASILAEYEEMQPGTISKMIEMTAKEQEHRHTLEIIKLKMQKTAIRMGRLFAVFTVIAICYTSLALAAKEMQFEALVFAAIGFLSVAIASCAGRCKKASCTTSEVLEKKPYMGNKKPYHNKPYNKPYNKPESQGSTTSEVSMNEGSTSKAHYRRKKR